MKHKEVKNPIVVRIDDVCPTMDFLKFERCINELREIGVKPLLGVIPLCEDISMSYGNVENFWEYIRRLNHEGYPIAMHGVHHVYCVQAKGLVCNRRMSEFSTLPYEEQKEKLLLGATVFRREGIKVDTFMAPGHSYDRNTLKALKSIGFDYITDGRSMRPYILEGIKCIPAMPMWKFYSGRGVLTICLHPNVDLEKSFLAVKLFLKSKKERIISFETAKKIKPAPYWISRIEEKIFMNATNLIQKVSLLFRKR